MAAIPAAILLALAVQSASAVDAVGFNRTPVPANSDALVSIPFTKAPEGAYTVSSVPGSGVVRVTGTVTGSYADTYYVRFTGGNANGLWSTITANTTSGFTLANTDVASRVVAGDTFIVYPHHTLSSLFPNGYEGISFITAGDDGVNPGATIVLIKDTSIGTDKAAAKMCVHLGSFGWYDGDWNQVDGLVLEPGTFVQVRNADEAKELDVFIAGDVPETKMAAVLPTSASGDNDLYLVNPYPVDVTLGQLGLETWASSEDGTTFKGLVLLYDNATAGTDKSASVMGFYLTGDKWYDGDWNDITNLIIPSGMGVVLRDSSGVAGTGVWSVNKPY